MSPIELPNRLRDMLDRLGSSERGIRRDSTPISPIELQNKLREKLDKLIRFLRGDKSYYAPRFPI